MGAKPKLRQHHLLAVCVLALGCLCFASVTAPQRFKRKAAVREKAVRLRMMQVWQAESIYLQRHGTYTDDMRKLTAEGLLADSLQYIPYSKRRKFELEANVEVSKTGRTMPEWQCHAPYEAWLDGLDARMTATLIEEACAAGRYPGISF